MKRNGNICKAIIGILEESPTMQTEIQIRKKVSELAEAMALEVYPLPDFKHVIAYHIQLLLDRGAIAKETPQDTGDGVYPVYRLTWEGHHYAEGLMQL